MTRWWWAPVLGLALACAGSATAHTLQSGPIRGVVYDETKAALPGATVTLTSTTTGFTQTTRPLDIAQYLIPGVQSAGDDFNINNYYRESSVYLKTTKGTTLLPRTSLPFPDKTNSLLIGGGSLISDNSRFTITTKDPNDSTKTRGNCAAPEEESPINVVSYYASIKNVFPNQYGQIYSYANNRHWLSGTSG